jgi:hypothetical protein
MAITINGSGTITGVSAGGLPDGSVTTDDIASAAVTDAKIASGVSSSKLSGALPALDGSALTGISTGFDPVYCSAKVTNSNRGVHNASTWTTVYFESVVVDSDSAFNLSTNTYTVPTTGIYCVTADIDQQHYSGSVAYDFQARLIINGSSTDAQGTGIDRSGTSGDYNHTLHIQAMYSFTANDTVSVQYSFVGATQYSVRERNTRLNIWRIG